MAQIRHQELNDIVDEIFTDARNKKVTHLVSDADTPVGRTVVIEGRPLVNFGTCGYLSLEHDARLKAAASQFVDRYGLQFSVSRVFMSAGINEMLENQLSQLYNGLPVLVYSSTSACHISILPIIVRSKDAVILDQSVHFGVQTAAQLVRGKGVPVEMIRHSNLDMLESMLQKFGNKYENVWYLIDGVYSMYGDVAPMAQLYRLLDKYPHLNLYVDDAHGMSWEGKNGSGCVFGNFGAHPRMVLVSTLAKGFGVVGGFTVFPNEEMRHKVRSFGGPLSYSHPLSPPVVGAALACTKIHRSPEIDAMQIEAAEKIAYCHKLLEEHQVPVISFPRTPIHFMGVGTPRLGMSVIKGMLDSGFFCSLATFPVVPVHRTGVRFTSLRHQEKRDIERFVSTLASTFRRVLKEEGVEESHVRATFGLPPLPEAKKAVAAKPESIPKERASRYRLQHATSITAFDKAEWDSVLGAEGDFDWTALTSLETLYRNQKKPEDKVDFHYYAMRDEAGKIVLATFFGLAICKDDFLSTEMISQHVEDKRKTDPYYLTTKTLAMGSLLTEGAHLYLDRSRDDWRDIMREFLDILVGERERLGAGAITLRDFDQDDHELETLLTSEGFVKIAMPNANMVTDMKWTNHEEFVENLGSYKRRRNARAEISRHLDKYDVEIKTGLSKAEADYAYGLYMNVKNRNLAINMFPYPADFQFKLSYGPNWEIMNLYLKEPYYTKAERRPVAVVLCYRAKDAYCPMVIGIDYDFNTEHKVYMQSLYQMVVRGKELGYDKISLGLSADDAKKKVGAHQIGKAAYMRVQDNFNLDALAAIS